MQKVFNLFLDPINEFSVLNYTFKKVENYYEVKNNGFQRKSIIIHEQFDESGFTESTEEVTERIGEHVRTFDVIHANEEPDSIFYEDGKRLHDIVLLMRFFLGDYVCLENETLEAWNKYEGDFIEPKGLFISNVIPKIETILTNFNSDYIKENKLDKLLFFYIEMQKNAYVDTKIALLGPIINILIDLNASKIRSEDTTNQIEILNELKTKINQDTNYSIPERELLSVALTKLTNSVGSDFTGRTVHYLKSHELFLYISDLENVDEKVQSYAQLINSLRNGILHSANLRATNIERRFRKARLTPEESTFTLKVRVFGMAKLLIVNSILNMMEIKDYYTKTQDIETTKEYFHGGTFRGL